MNGIAATCEWCQDGERTSRFDPALGTWVAYACGHVAANGCGTWSLDKACELGEQPLLQSSKHDANGLPSRLGVHTSMLCAGPKTQLPDDACLDDADCGDAKLACERVDGLRRCASRLTWVTGSGTWDYASTHHEWEISGLLNPPTIACERGRDAFWFGATDHCVVTLEAVFAPQTGGLHHVTIHIDVDSNRAKGSTGPGVELATSTDVPEHAGEISKTIDQVVLDGFELAPKGYVFGSWVGAGTITGGNTLHASGEFMVALP
jgi:hypothetical protein